MNTASGGNICIRGWSTSGYYSDLYVYVSNDNQNWVTVATLCITQSSPYWITVGTVKSNFLYIAVAGYDSGNSVNLHLDAVRVN
jgi:hypothetical protein